MSKPLRIVCISGTSRPDNYTSRALAVVADELRASGATAEVFDARDLTLAFPGQPPTPDARRLKEAVASAAGIVLATPEYHGSFSAMTKLIIENLGFPSELKGKPIALLGVAAGRIGAIKSIEHLRGVCAHVGGLVVPDAISIAGVQAAFGADGQPVDKGTDAALRGLAHSLLEYLAHYVCPKYVLEAAVRDGHVEPWVSPV